MRRGGAYQRVEDQHAVGFSEDPDDEGEEAGEKRHETGHVDAADVVAEVADGRAADGLAQVDWCASSALGAQETHNASLDQGMIVRKGNVCTLHLHSADMRAAWLPVNPIELA